MTYYRLTATDALAHPYLSRDIVTDKQLSVQKLDNFNLIQFNAKRRFKKAANAVIWSNRIKRDAYSSKHRRLAEIIAELDTIDEKKSKLLAIKQQLEESINDQSNPGSPTGNSGSDSSSVDSPVDNPVDRILDDNNSDNV